MIPKRPNGWDIPALMLPALVFVMIIVYTGWAAWWDGA